MMCEAPPLSTARLLLRPARADDFAACAALWGDAGVVRYIGGTPSTPSRSWDRLLRLTGLWPLLGYGYWVLEDKATGRFAGQLGFADFKRDIDVSIESVPEAGWVLAPDFHGRGYATEAMTAALAWADEHIGAPHTCCLIDPDNAASFRVADKLGYSSPRLARLDDQQAVVLWREKPAR